MEIIPDFLLGAKNKRYIYNGQRYDEKGLLNLFIKEKIVGFKPEKSQDPLPILSFEMEAQNGEHIDMAYLYDFNTFSIVQYDDTDNDNKYDITSATEHEDHLALYMTDRLSMQGREEVDNFRGIDPNTDIPRSIDVSEINPNFFLADFVNADLEITGTPTDDNLTNWFINNQGDKAKTIYNDKPFTEVLQAKIDEIKEKTEEIYNNNDLHVLEKGTYDGPEVIASQNTGAVFFNKSNTREEGPRVDDKGNVVNNNNWAYWAPPEGSKYIAHGAMETSLEDKNILFISNEEKNPDDIHVVKISDKDGDGLIEPPEGEFEVTGKLTKDKFLKIMNAGLNENKPYKYKPVNLFKE